MENEVVERELPNGAKIIRTTTSGGRSNHMRMLATAMASAAMMAPVREEDPEPRTVLPFGGLSYQGSWRGAGEIRTSGKGEPFAARKRALRKTKKKMRQQSRKKK